MARQRHLKNAPIVEALIDLRVNVQPEFDAGEFLKLSKELSDRYPKFKPRKLITGAVGLHAGKPFVQPPEDKGIHGYIFQSTDDKEIAQFRKDGFTFSRLHPYTEWENIFSEASRLWNLFCSKTPVDMITRIAVRYINRLDLPLPMNDFAEYLTAPPKVPKSLPQALSQFLTKIVFQEADITANVIQTLDKSHKPDHVGIILDIDVFKMNSDGFDKETVLSQFGQLRTFKNRIFFSQK